LTSPAQAGCSRKKTCIDSARPSWRYARQPVDGIQIDCRDRSRCIVCTRAARRHIARTCRSDRRRHSVPRRTGRSAKRSESAPSGCCAGQSSSPQALLWAYSRNVTRRDPCSRAGGISCLTQLSPPAYPQTERHSGRRDTFAGITGLRPQCCNTLPARRRLSRKSKCTANGRICLPQAGDGVCRGRHGLLG